MKVSDLFVKALEKEGVKYIFGVPGEENEDLLFSLSQSPIHFIPTRHEQGAAFMANVWGRLTGQAGVCLSTLGPGATNLITGVADAQLDKSPVVAITAQGDLARVHHESHQYLDIVNIFKPITKWNAAISSPEVVTEVIRKAFKVAEYEKPGACHIELPEDIAGADAHERLEPIEPKKVRRPAPDPKALQNAIDLLKHSKHPLIIAGNGAVRKLASKHLTRLVKEHDIPVVSTFMGKGAVSDKEKQSLFTIGLGFKDYVLDVVSKSDLVITVGYDIAEYPPQRWNPEGDKKIIHIDFVPAEVYTNYNPDIEIVGDVSACLWALNERLKSEPFTFDDSGYLPTRERILEDIKSYDLKEGEEFHVPGVINLIRESMADDGLIISDVGAHKMWIARNFPTYVPNGCLVSNGLASMGISLPGGVAASLLQPDRQVVSLMGDGGFMMNSQELETAKRLGVGFTIVLVNDNDFGLIRWKQTMSKGSSVYTKLSNPDFIKYAESFGIQAYRPGTLTELRDTLRHCIQSRELSLVEVPISAEANQELVHKLKLFWEAKG